jgi:UDP-galactopyranose mutase
MDELTAFAGAPTALRRREAELLARVDLVFTGGRALYEHKRDLHESVHVFPSSVDAVHFRAARASTADPASQAEIPHPRVGYAGVVDERMDLRLLDAVAAARPDWQLVLVGPVLKIDEATLPRRPNIHYLGERRYSELPAYVGGWDVATIPFARNEATRYVSPTKTLEYLAAGLPIVSTSIRDVVRPYGDEGLAWIADEPDGFVAAVENALAQDRGAFSARADELLARTSWDRTWAGMDRLVAGVIALRSGTAAAAARP